MPDFEPVDPATLSLKRPVYEPTAKEIDEAVDELAKQNRTYETKTGKAVKAKDGDMVVIDFLGKVDDVAFEGARGDRRGAGAWVRASSSRASKSNWSAPSPATTSR